MRTTSKYQILFHSRGSNLRAFWNEGKWYMMGKYYPLLWRLFWNPYIFVYYRGCRHSVRVLSLLILHTARASKYHCNSFLPFLFSLFSVYVTLFFCFLNRHLLWLHVSSSFGGHLQWTKVQSPWFILLYAVLGRCFSYRLAIHLKDSSKIVYDSFAQERHSQEPSFLRKFLLSYRRYFPWHLICWIEKWLLSHRATEPSNVLAWFVSHRSFGTVC